jgi:shikimate kinase
MNIVLIGYRGTGKSTVATMLAERLGREVVSTDAMIIKRVGRSIPEIIEQKGWEYFRDQESEVCREVAQQDHLVIDTGGGAILRQDNVEWFKKSGTLFWLTAEVATIAERIGDDTQRPSLTGTQSFVDEISAVVKERQPRYQAAADHLVATDQQTPKQVADSIEALLK